MTTIIKDETLTAIGNAIREKTGKTNKLTPAEMVTEIAGITTGGGEGELEQYWNDTLLVFKSKTLKKVPYQAFYDKKNLRAIDLPECTNIDGMAFSGCVSLELPVLPPKVSVIGSSAFANDPKVTIKKILLPTYLGSNAFYNCAGLTKVYIKTGKYPGLVRLDGNIFKNSPNLTDVYLDAASNLWEPNAFPTTTTVHYGVSEQEFDEILAAGGTE